MLRTFQWRGLGARFDNRRRERTEIVQLFGDDGVDDIKVEAGVFVNGHVVEADHPLPVQSLIRFKDYRSSRSGGVLRAPWMMR